MIIQILIVQILTFVGMALFLRHLLISSSYKETSRLQKLNEENAKKSQELAAKLAEAENTYREKITRAEDEARRLRAQARKESDALKESIIAKGKAESEHIIAEALDSKKDLRIEIESELKERTVGLSCAIFQKVLNSSEQRFVYDGLLDTVLKELDEIDKERLKTIDLGGDDANKIDVKTSHPMSEKQKERLEKILSSKLDQKISVEEKVDNQVISGIIIQMNSFVIDGSLTERFRKAAEEME